MSWYRTEQILLPSEMDHAEEWEGLCDEMLTVLRPHGEPGMLDQVCAVQMASAMWEMLRETCDARTYREHIDDLLNDEHLHMQGRERVLRRSDERGRLVNIHIERVKTVMELNSTLRGVGMAREREDRPLAEPLKALNSGTKD